MNTKIPKAPAGFRILAGEDTIIPAGKGAYVKFYFDGKWHDSDGSFSIYATLGMLCPGWYCAVKKGAYEWTLRTIDNGPEVTKEGFRIQAGTLCSEINLLGIENAKLKNQLAALRRKKAPK